MSFWSAMNWVAWGLCAFLAVVIAQDFIRVEKARLEDKRQGR